MLKHLGTVQLIALSLVYEHYLPVLFYNMKQRTQTQSKSHFVKSNALFYTNSFFNNFH